MTCSIKLNFDGKFCMVATINNKAQRKALARS